MARTNTVTLRVKNGTYTDESQQRRKYAKNIKILARKRKEKRPFQMTTPPSSASSFSSTRSSSSGSRSSSSKKISNTASAPAPAPAPAQTSLFLSQRIQKSPSHSNSKKKSFCVLGDVYGVVMVPKELDLEKPNSFELIRFQLPDLTKPVKEFLRSREVGELVSGALAGAMTKAILAPLETIRTRMVVGVGSRNISGSFIEVIEQQGWQGLWAGNTVNILRIIPTQAIEFGTFEYVKRAMTSTQEKWNQNDGPRLQIGHVNLKFSLSWISPVAVAGAAAGVVSMLACHPLEVLKDRLTVTPEAYPSIAIAVSKIYMDGGIGAFYAGISPTLIGMLPYSTCYYFMYETLKKSYCFAKKKKSLSLQICSW